MSSEPIVFIHYGGAPYLRWTLRTARRTNPDAKIVLLGDRANRRAARGIVDFVSFEELGGGEKDREFSRVFQVIQGERHRFNKLGGVEFWLRFVFRRWFLIEEFLIRNGIESFWTFDSDTLILSKLAERSRRFLDYDATVQCKGECLNGWIGSRSLVSRYTASILDQFRDEDFLRLQRERLNAHAGLAFNEMDAFAEFRRRSGCRTWHAEQERDGEIFDDALAFVDGFEASEYRVLRRTEVKKLWTDGHAIYARRLQGDFLRMVTCNMSWMPEFLWRRIMHNACRKPNHDPGEARVLSLQPRVLDQCFTMLKTAVWAVTRSRKS